MPPETLVGTRIPHLLAAARARLGDDALVVDVRRPAGEDAFELCVADAVPPAAPPARGSRPCAPSVWAGCTTRPRVLALVGPTGAGKTTTLAKLATHPEAYDGARVGLLGLDTFRVGAIEQARLYGELTGRPFEVAYDEDELARVARRLAKLDVVLVDTAGRGPGRVEESDATLRLVQALEPDEVHLVAPAGLSPVRARRLADEYAPFAPTHLLITKLDEYPEERGLFALARDRGWPVRFRTDGQGVPGDLQVTPDTAGGRP